MLHGVRLADRSATYRNRWVRTKGFVAETGAGHALWRSIVERPDLRNPLGPLKNTANTDIAFHAGRLLALWWLGGDAYLIGLPDLDTRGAHDFGCRQPIAAHPKVDPRSGEMMFLSHSPQSASFDYGVAAADGSLTHVTSVELPGPRLHHDLAITEHYSVLLDMPMMAPDPRAFVRGGLRLRYRADQPSRLGLIPRHGRAEQVRWFEVPPCFVYHTVNAWEDRNTVVVLACRNPPSAIDPSSEDFTKLIFRSRLSRWTLDLTSGIAKEEDLDDLPTEFPRTDDRRLGVQTRYSYQSHIRDSPTMLFDAVVKYDTGTGQRLEHRYPPGWYGGEAVFAPREGSAAEDDGYLLTFVTEEATGRSQLYLLDAQNVRSAPVARIELPQRVPVGFHARWVPQPR
jgi:carotenoid cleavage dioxygenase